MFILPPLDRRVPVIKLVILTTQILSTRINDKKKLYSDETDLEETEAKR